MLLYALKSAVDDLLIGELSAEAKVQLLQDAEALLEIR